MQILKMVQQMPQLKEKLKYKSCKIKYHNLKWLCRNKWMICRDWHKKPNKIKKKCFSWSKQFMKEKKKKIFSLKNYSVFQANNII